MSQKEFANAINISPACVTFWVAGKKQPTAENIYISAKVLETTSDYLLGLSDFE